jgi:hypothetical protein
MTMGQKLYARAFEQDEVLLAVGFLDVGVHVTSLQSMKNFLLIGDALQSVTLVAFQVGPAPVMGSRIERDWLTPSLPIRRRIHTSSFCWAGTTDRVEPRAPTS